MDEAWSKAQEALSGQVATLRRYAALLRGKMPGGDAVTQGAEAEATRGGEPGMPAIRRSLRSHVMAVALIAVFLVGSIGVLGAVTDLAGAVIAAGSLVVESNVKKVQHPTGGVVGELLVQDGARVEGRRPPGPARPDGGPVQPVRRDQGAVGADRAARPARSRTRGRRDGGVPARSHARKTATPRSRASSPAKASCSSCAATPRRGRRRSFANASSSSRKRPAG